MFIALGTYYQKNLTDLFELENEEANEYLVEQQKVIEEQKKSLEQQNVLLLEQQSDITEQREKMEEKSKQLHETHYVLKKGSETAASLQEALLPKQEEFLSIFEKAVLYYQPKDIVSGDFYWLEKIEGGCILAVADCTGHGVPGALMTMVGHQLLNRIVLVEGEQSPHKILTRLHAEVRKQLDQEEGVNRSGMDMGIVKLLTQEDGGSMAYFAGAKRSLWHQVGNDSITVAEGSRKSIGGRDNPKKQFEEVEVPLPKGSRLYLLTDGMGDQNGMKPQKVTEKRMRKWLDEEKNAPLYQQMTGLIENFENYIVGKPQRDDQLLVAVEL